MAAKNKTEVEIVVEKVIEPMLAQHAVEIAALYKKLDDNHQEMLVKMEYTQGLVKNYLDKREASAQKIKNEIKDEVDLAETHLRESHEALAKKVEEIVPLVVLHGNTLKPFIAIQGKMWSVLIMFVLSGGVIGLIASWIIREWTKS